MSPTCDDCGAHVSSDWARVFRVNGEVPMCIECSSNSDRANVMADKKYTKRNR